MQFSFLKQTDNDDENSLFLNTFFYDPISAQDAWKQ